MATMFNLVKKSLGVAVFTPDNYLTPILRYGIYDRLAPPGFHPIVPLVERSLAPVKTSMRVALLKLADVLTKDGIPFAIHLTVRYRFDPRCAPREVAAQFVQASDRLLENIVTDYTSQGLRRVITRSEAMALCQPGVVECAERDLQRYLNAALKPLGIQLPASGGVLLRELLPPPRFKRALLDANMHRVTLDALADAAGLELIGQALQAEFVAKIDGFRGNELLTPPLEAAVLRFLLAKTSQG